MAATAGVLAGLHARSRQRRPGHLAELAGSDPVQDHERIARVTAQWEFPWDTETALSLALFRTFAVPSISTVLASSRAFRDEPRRRYDDTELLLAEVQEHGVATERGRAALRRVNRMHAAYDLDPDDMRYVLSTFVVQPDDWIARFGWRPLTDAEREAAWRFWRAVGQRMGVTDLPEDRRTLVAFSRDFEARSFVFHPDNHRVADATMRMYLAEVLRIPAPLRPLAQRAVLALLEPPLVAALGYPAPPRWLRVVVPAALRLRARVLAWFVPPRRRPVRLTERPRPSYPGGYDIAQLGTFPHRRPVTDPVAGDRGAPTRREVPGPTRRGHHRVDTGEVTLDVEVRRPPRPVVGTPVLLVSGLGAQRTDWPPGLVDALLASGREVITFDNRDAGLSEGCDERPGDERDLERWRDGEPFEVAYTLSDLRDDALAVLDHLGLDAAHVLGRSMGGMIAQRLAAEAPERVVSLTSMQSTTGAADVGQPSEAAMEAIARPTPPTREAVIAASLERNRITGSPGLIDEDAVRARLEAAYDRAYRPAGTTRQLLAILAEPDRTPLLGTITAPTLVVHGDRDTLVAVSGGRATAAAIPGARLEVVEGMGHDLPAPLIAPVARVITDHLDAAER
ncbi:MAG: alpha/beta fold hydrolase [Nitriliruptoraceae bacterium]|nr:alpha/beta fold hydrolase [Nitriliruptoraceae bacterium]